MSPRAAVFALFLIGAIALPSTPSPHANAPGEHADGAPWGAALPRTVTSSVTALQRHAPRHVRRHRSVSPPPVATVATAAPRRASPALRPPPRVHPSRDPDDP
ncbi:MAG: hypothetical protein H6719_36540 [Sandaracinaceae bacterium]|nr:hypothetical protein [Sandaracinaceae bacterium]